jgi:type I restriction enzyme S subunit
MAERDEIPDAKDIPTECDFLRLGEFRDKAKRSVNPARFPDEQFELYSVPSYEAGVPETVPGSEIGSNKISVQPNSVLFCRINPHISRSWVTGNYTKNRKIASTEWVVFPENSTLSPKFLKYFLQTSDFYDYLQMNVSGVGGSLTRARVDAIDDYQFPLPPLPEQHAIVAKIEVLCCKDEEIW